MQTWLKKTRGTQDPLLLTWLIYKKKICWYFLTCDRSVVYSGTPVSSTNKTDRHSIIGIWLKVSLNTITLPYPLLFLQNWIQCAFNLNNWFLLSIDIYDNSDFIKLTVSFLFQFWASTPIMGGVRIPKLKFCLNILH